MCSSEEFQRKSIRRSGFVIQNNSQRVQLIKTNLHAIVLWAEDFAAKELERGHFSIDAAEEFARQAVTAASDAAMLLREMKHATSREEKENGAIQLHLN